jgi:hypothetical protein
MPANADATGLQRPTKESHKMLPCRQFKSSRIVDFKGNVAEKLKEQLIDVVTVTGSGQV